MQVPTGSGLYFMAPAVSYLRECPGHDCKVIDDLSQGDAVTLLNSRGNWWRVRSERTGHIGWVPAAQVAQAFPKLAKPAAVLSQKSYLFVGASNLNLYSLPLASSPVVKVLHGNNKMEKLSEAGSGWVKVRDSLSGTEGWTLGRYLKESPVPPQSLMDPKRKKWEKKPVKRPKKKIPSEPEPLKPEAM
jgi:uncharacterized protein YgiM (DUF1202 family)